MRKPQHLYFDYDFTQSFMRFRGKSSCIDISDIAPVITEFNSIQFFSFHSKSHHCQVFITFHLLKALVNFTFASRLKAH